MSDEEPNKGGVVAWNGPSAPLLLVADPLVPMPPLAPADGKGEPAALIPHLPLFDSPPLFSPRFPLDLDLAPSFTHRLLEHRA